MREVVEQILDGTYDYEKGALDFSCAKLEIELQEREIYEGSFTIYASEGKYTVGYITTTDPRMECLSTEIHGNQEEIAFRFHGEWMEEGEVTKGEFRVVSNKGEYYLPYVVSLVHAAPQSSIGPIKNLLQFTSLAKSYWKEAVEVFYSPAFGRVLKECGNQLYLSYQGLSALPGNEQHVEEFLVAANKKQRVEYLVSEKRIFLENPVGIVEQPLNIFRNGWGYTRLEVWCDGDFLFVEKNVITEDDFLGNRFTLPIYVDTGLLHQGRNMGNIILKSAGGNVEIPITILQKSADSHDYLGQTEYKKNICKLLQAFQSFRLKKMNKTDWLRDTTKIIDRMVTMNEKDITTRLFQAHLLITKEQRNEAGWILEHVGDLMEEEISPAVEAYYIYLNTLYRKEEGYTGEMSWQVSKIYREYGEDWRVAWLLLFLSDEYDKNPASRWDFLKEQFHNGCRSPLIYLEALLILNMNPTLIRKLGVFEMQVLNYGRKQESIGIELLEQVIYLAERVKEFDALLYAFLVDCYRQKTDERVLKEICTLLIKGNKTDRSAFEWFAKGVNAEIRITNLYEYYMLSMDLNEEQDIPKQVLLYFTYQTNLDYLHNAYLFYYVAKKGKVLGEIYNNYRPRIEMFVKEQIEKGHINHHLAYLYKQFLKEQMIDESMAKSLATLLFSNEIRLGQKDIRSIIVCQPNHLKEQRYPVNGDKVWVPLYGKACCVMFENQQGVRFACDIPHTMEKLMDSTNLLEQVVPYVEDNPSLDIYLYGKATTGDEVSAEEVERWLRLAKYPYLPDSVRGDIVLQLIRYYYNEDNQKHLMTYLSTLNGDFMSAFQRGEVVRYMVLCDCMELAYEWVEHYGNCKVDDKILLHLLETRIERENGSQDKLETYAFSLMLKGVYSSATIRFLMSYYQGLTRDLRKIWNISKDYSMDRKAFCERILIQLLFSGYFVTEQQEIFKEYVFSNGNERIQKAYLAKNSYEFFANDKLIQKEALVEISRLHTTGQEVLEICQLAYLKYYAENMEEIQKEDVSVIRDFLDGMLQKGIRMNCFCDLHQFSTMPMHLMDKTIVEYRTTKNVQPVIHYLILKEDGEAGDYLTEPMEHVMGGVYIKEFILFFGESLQYYIVEDELGEGKLTQSGTMQRGEMLGEELPGRYGMINDIIISKVMQDYDTFDNLLEEYYRNDFYNQELFKPRK